MNSTIHSETEEHIFDAALEVFSRKGKTGARMQEIADQAGINKAMLHYYFRSKDGLYEAVFGHVFGRFMESLDTALAEVTSFDDALKVFIDSYLAFNLRQPAVVRLMMQENLTDAEVARQHIRRAMDPGSGAPPRTFLERIGRAVESGEIRRVDPLHTFVSLLGACVFAFIALPTVSAMNHDLDKDPRRFLQDRGRHIYQLFHNGLRPVAQ